MMLRFKKESQIFILMINRNESNTKAVDSLGMGPYYVYF